MLAGQQHARQMTGSRRAMLDTLLRHLPMVRLRVPAPRRVSAAVGLALAAATMAACAGEITFPGPGGDTEDPAVTAAKAKFASDVKPVLDGFCGACHTGMPNIDFMNPTPDVRDNMLAWTGLVNLSAPTQSSLLSKGAHSGPALTPDQSAVMLDWIELEAVAAGGEPAEVVETDRITPQPGVNVVDLSAIGLTGTSLQFLYEPLATGMYLSDIKVVAGAGGAHLVNPLFVIWEADAPNPDPINRFGNIDLLLQAGEESFVGGGTAVFVDVDPLADISIHFRTATLADGSGGGGGGGDGGVVGGGCNNVPAFTASARTPLSGSCGGCHANAGNADAVAAVDMRLINDLTADSQASSCAQVKTRVNELDPVNSGLFLAPDPNSGTAHPFKFPTAGDFTNFRDQVIQWINQE